MPPATRRLVPGRCKGAGLVVLAVLVVTLAACAARPAAGGGDGSSSPRNDGLTVELDRGDGSPVQRWSLSCADTVTGTHPAAQEACAHLSGIDDPFAPIPGDRVCSQQYGGPQTATVTGRWAGRPVDLELSRVDGCRIAQWNGLGPLLPG